jgi:hypothetical protein
MRLLVRCSDEFSWSAVALGVVRVGAVVGFRRRPRLHLDLWPLSAVRLESDALSAALPL